MTSEVDICKFALGYIRAGSINSLNESSIQAQTCKLYYEPTRDEVLEDCIWGFAHRVKPLAVLSNVSVDLFNHVYVYQYPSDCLKINRLVLNFEEVSSDSSLVAARIYDHNFPVPNLDRYKVEYDVYYSPETDGKVIGANEPELRVDYIVKVKNPNLFPTKFVTALSYLLASKIAIPLVGVKDGRAMRDDYLKLYSSYIGSAAADNESERHSNQPDSEYISVRL